jgi:hypothetical protein
VKNEVMMAGGSMHRLFEGRMNDVPEQVFAGDDRIIESKELQYPYGFWRFIYNRDMLTTNRIYFPLYMWGEDPPFMLEAMIRADKMWITPKCTYIYRMYDKKPNFCSAKVIQDVTSSYLDVMEMGKNVCYDKMEKYLLRTIERWKKIFMAHVVHGNRELLNSIQKIGTYITDDETRNEFLEFWSYDNIIRSADRQAEREKGYREMIRESNGVIIYGAGGIGKTVYDFIEPMKDINFLGFAVSDRNPDGTSRGHKIQSIYDFMDYKETALVIIAGEKKLADEMKETANSIGFIHIQPITEKLVDYDGFIITDQKFAY